MRAASKTGYLGAVVLAAACSYAGPGPGSPPSDLERTGRYPGACGWLRVDDEGNRRRTERTYEGERLVTEVTFDESDRTRTTPSRLVRSRRFVYDEDGNQIRVEAFDAAERRTSRLAYDARGRWVSTEVDSTGRKDERYYDKEGRVTARRVVSTRGGQVLQLHTFERDAAGEIVSERIEFPGEGRSERIEFARDDDAGILERLTRRSPRDALEQRDVYTFTPSGHLASMVRHGDVRLTQHYRHDDDGNLLRVDTWDEEGEPIAATIYDYSCWQSGT